MGETQPLTFSHMLTLEWYGCGIVSGNTIMMVDVPALMLKNLATEDDQLSCSDHSL